MVLLTPTTPILPEFTGSYLMYYSVCTLDISRLIFYKELTKDTP